MCLFLPPPSCLCYSPACSCSYSQSSLLLPICTTYHDDLDPGPWPCTGTPRARLPGTDPTTISRHTHCRLCLVATLVVKELYFKMTLLTLKDAMLYVKDSLSTKHCRSCGCVYVLWTYCLVHACVSFHPPPSFHKLYSTNPPYPSSIQTVK